MTFQEIRILTGSDEQRMSEPLEPTLGERVRALNEARKLEEPRIQAMVKDVRFIRTEISGQAQCVHLALANSREAVEDVKCLKEIVVLQADTITGLQNELSALQATITELSARVERQGAWITSQVERAPKPPASKKS